MTFIQVEIWKFTKNKFLNFFNSIKADFLFAALNRNRIIRKRSTRKKTHFMDDAFKTMDVLNVETWFLLTPVSKFLATRLVIAH